MVAKLFPHQVIGVDWLAEREYALLGDDPGMGKTRQTILAQEKLGKRHLVICPATMKWVWDAEYKEVESPLEVTVVSGTKEERAVQCRAKSGVVVINYELAHRHRLDLARGRWDSIAIDEAHRVRGRANATTKSIYAISRFADHRYELTGSPIVNRASELWSLFHILNPKRYGSYWRFVESFCRMEYNGFGWEPKDITDPSDLDYFKTMALKAEMTPFFLRREKSEIEGLPEKLPKMQLPVELEGSQLKAYRELEEKFYHEFENGFKLFTPTTLSLITRLRQIAIDPDLILNERDDLKGPKVDALLDYLESLGDKKVVIFSNFRTAIDRLQRTLDKRGVSSVKLTGRTKDLSRKKSIQDFQNGPAQCFLSTIRSGGVGITLHAAHHVIFLDKDWVPALNDQAADRVHRIGQKHPVQVTEIDVLDSVETYLDKIIAGKREIIDILINNPMEDVE